MNVKSHMDVGAIIGGILGGKVTTVKVGQTTGPLAYHDEGPGRSDGTVARGFAG